MHLALIGGSGHLCPTVTIILNLRGVLFTLPHDLLGLRQFVVAIDSHNLLDLVFYNLIDLKPVPSYSDLVKPEPISPSLNY
jgi:hypothetical protein